MQTDIWQKQINSCRETLSNSLPFAVELTDKQCEALASSDFICQNLLRHPNWWQDLQDNPPNSLEWESYAQQLTSLLTDIDDEDGLMKVLRLFRQQKMLRIAWVQWLQTISTQEILILLSELADQILIVTNRWLYQYYSTSWGTPCDESGNPQPLFILGMGKLGGKELNFSSDIDLIFTYPSSGMTQGGRRQMENNEFFNKLAQRLIKVLNQPTVDGQVFRVDMRLRPFGDSGPLVLSFSALEHYYQEHGRDWERYAMIKARLIGEHSENITLENMLRPFIYRRYIDFSVIESLRNMKLMIEREVRRRHLDDNIKLGLGGIRELEFIVQVFQLMRGGREQQLRQRSWLNGLQSLEQLNLLPKEDIEFLHDYYFFLRRTENLLQAIADQQTQLLPDDALGKARLCVGMGLPSWQTFMNYFESSRHRCRAIFDKIIQPDEQTTIFPYHERFQMLWLDILSRDELRELAPYLSAEQADEVLSQIKNFRGNIEKRVIGARGRDVLDKLMPYVLAKISQIRDQVGILSRVLQVIINIVSRTTYLELLLKNTQALNQLVTLCASSAMITKQLAQYPVLLDDLLNLTFASVDHVPHDYRDELRKTLLRLDIADEEQHLNTLRLFKQSQWLRIAAADINHHLTVMQVSDQLSYVAEVIVEHVLQQAWADVTARYGQPSYLSEKSGQGFIMVGYGKLGGRELAYYSDLDLVFISDSPLSDVTDGQRQIESNQFYVRLLQRALHLLSTRTVFGSLFEVDLRLRPEGNSGVLVTSMDAFEQYQKHEAWNWEHQALVRARVLCGDDVLTQRFNQIRQQVLTSRRDEKTLIEQIISMRQKMYQHFIEQNSSQYFDLKRDEGGLVDIEFVVQYAVLRYAHQYPQLTVWQDNVNALMMLVELGCFAESETKNIIDIYHRLRHTIHLCMLQDKPIYADPLEWVEARQQVKQFWIRIIGRDYR